MQPFWLRLCNAATGARLVKENIEQSKHKREESTDSVDREDEEDKVKPLDVDVHGSSSYQPKNGRPRHERRQHDTKRTTENQKVVQELANGASGVQIMAEEIVKIEEFEEVQASINRQNANFVFLRASGTDSAMIMYFATISQRCVLQDMVYNAVRNNEPIKDVKLQPEEIVSRKQGSKRDNVETTKCVGDSPERQKQTASSVFYRG